MDLGETSRTVFGVLNNIGASADIFATDDCGTRIYNLIRFSAPDCGAEDVADAIAAAFQSDPENSLIALDGISEEYIEYAQDDIEELAEGHVVIVLDERKFFGVENPVDIRQDLHFRYPRQVLWLERERG